MKVFITGATGYIGGSLARKLVSTGHEVLGLVRSDDKAAKLKAAGIEPVLGSLADFAVIQAAARRADASVNTANSDDSFVAKTLIEALAGSDKPLIHTSGSSVVSDLAAGEYSDAVFNEDWFKEQPHPDQGGGGGGKKSTATAAASVIKQGGGHGYAF